MTVIEISLVVLIVWVLCFTALRYKNGPACGFDETIGLIVGSLGLTLGVFMITLIAALIAIGLWCAPWYEWFYNKLW